MIKKALLKRKPNPPTTIYSAVDAGSDVGWSGYNVATIFLAANFTADAAANNIRITLKFGPATVAGSVLDECWIGAQGTVSAWNFDGRQVQIKFSGLPSYTLAGGSQTIVSDFVPYTVYDNTKNFVLRMHFTGTVDIRDDNGSLGNLGAYYNGPLASQAGTTNPTGTWTQESPNKGYAMFKAEMQSAVIAGYPTQTTYSSQASVIGLSRPAYLTKTALGNGFNTAITRITDSNSNFGIGNRLYTHTYAKRYAWNCDSSKIVLLYPPAYYLLDGHTYAYINSFGTGLPPGDAICSTINPDIIWGTPGNNTLVKFLISTQSSTVVHTFSAYTSIAVGQGEGTLSNDDRFVPILGNGSGIVDCIVYDKLLDTLSAAHTYTNSVDSIDWFGLSQSGNYAVVKTVRSGTAVYDIYDRTMTLIRTSAHYAGDHSDFGFDPSGNEVIFHVSSADGSTTAFSTIKLSDDTTAVQLPAIVNCFSTHVSCRNWGRPGYGYVSTFAHATPNAQYAYHEIYSVKLDGSGTVERFTQDFKAELPLADFAYEREARATVNRYGSKVLYASDFLDASSSATIHTYVAEVV